MKSENVWVLVECMKCVLSRMMTVVQKCGCYLMCSQEMQCKRLTFRKPRKQYLCILISQNIKTIGVVGCQAANQQAVLDLDVMEAAKID